MMKLRFGYVNTHMTEKYSGKDDLRVHFAWWTKAWGKEPQQEWVHIFCHTLEIIPVNWYLETELCHGTTERDILRESFLLTFNFENGFECIDEALQELKANNFRAPVELVQWVQTDLSTQLCHVLECYNVTMKEGNEDP